MFLRVLFMLLLAMNIGVASWLYFAPQHPAEELPASDAGISRLVLLSERDQPGDAASSELAEAPESRTALANERCRSIGPFPTQSDMRSAMNKLTPLSRRIQYREARATQARGYWVFLPAVPTREQALVVARELSSKGVRDYYVVTAGDQQNTISLGLFRDQSNAERRRAEIVALGFAPELIQRTEDLPVYWIDFAEDPARSVKWQVQLSDALDLREEAVNCF